MRTHRTEDVVATKPAVDRAREAFGRAAWREAANLWAEADRDGALALEDLAHWATTAYLVGQDAEADDLWARAHKGSLDRGDVGGAARCAFWLGVGLLLRGETTRGGAWIGRAQHVLEGVTAQTAEHGYLFVAAGLGAIGGGDADRAYLLFRQAMELADRFHDPDLLAMARLGCGQALTRSGEASRGLALLDEAMVAIIAGEVGARVAGMVFCGVIETCHDAFDLRRGQEWTEAMTRWCATQPDLMPYRGQCSVYRAQVLRVHGDWDDALAAAEQACQRLSQPSGPPGRRHGLLRSRRATQVAWRLRGRRGGLPRGQPGRAQSAARAGLTGAVARSG